jgi:hypothetical protein
MVENDFCGNDNDDGNKTGNGGLNYLKLIDQIIYIQNFRCT